MAEQEVVPPAVEGSDEPIEVPKRDQTPKEPPVTFRDFDVSQFCPSNFSTFNFFPFF